MPFQSQAQRSFMYANHPEIAKRWETVTPKDHGLPKRIGNANPQSESHETWKKGVQRLARKPGAQRDFGMLKPSQVARHKLSKAANEKEAEGETPVAFTAGSRHSELGKPEHPTGLTGRDVRTAFGHPSIKKR